MELRTMGFDEWFASRSEELLKPGQKIARVLTVDRGACVVRDELGDCSAEISGKLRFDAEEGQDLPCVGDWVCIGRASDKLAIIHSILPRKTCLQRKTPGKTVEFQMIASNIDTAFIVQSCHYDFNVRRLDRYMVVVYEAGVTPVIVLSKTDLVTPDELQALIDSISSAGIVAEIISLSNTSGDGLDAFRSRLEPGKTYCLLGSSGVGKSTLINRVIGNDALETKDVSETGEGVHTTSRRQLIVLENGSMMIDTPGMRELGLLGASDAVEDTFADVADLALECRFSDCTHIKEPGCAILAATECGELAKERYESYIKLRKETEFHDMSYFEKRKKDKNFGKFIKQVKKDLDR